jgi:hypothetical protein
MEEELDIVNEAAKKPAVKKARKKAPVKKAATKKPVVKPNSDAAKIISTPAEKFLIKMQRGASYQTASGITFNRAHPFQLVDASERDLLVGMGEERFVLATPDEARDYYSK